jgi:hypothetical protein
MGNIFLAYSMPKRRLVKVKSDFHVSILA